MPRTRAPATQADVSRLVRGALGGGIAVERIVGIRMTKDGVTLLLGESAPVQDGDEPNEWDGVLPK